MTPKRLAQTLAVLALTALVLVTTAAADAGKTGSENEKRYYPAELDFAEADATPIAGLEDRVRVRRDDHNVPHVIAMTDRDALFMLGWLHAEDRLFQMDVLRRTFSGTLAELVGAAALPQDVQFRTLGLRRGAEESADAASAAARVWMEAYAEGVNAFVAATPAMPPEYGALALTKASFAPWTLADTLVIGKGLAFGLSFDLDDLDFTEDFLAFRAAGQVLGFDGPALWSEDLYRSAPFDPSVSIPGFLAQAGVRTNDPELAKVTRLPKTLPPYLERVPELVQKLEDKLAAAPALSDLTKRRETPIGSNWWIAGGGITESGFPILANDPHLGLDTPSIFYEVHLRVPRGLDDRPMNVFGVSFPGTAGVILGCNPYICWGATTNPMDVTDVYLEEVIFDPQSGPATVFDGQLEPLVVIPQSYRVNVLDPGEPDTLADAGVGPDDGGLTLVVPRRNHGPIVSIVADPQDPAHASGLSVQYTGWRATFELEALLDWARAQSIEDFAEGLERFDVGSQNWSVAERGGRVAYFTSAEMPIREDLQNLNFPDGGIPPFLVRDGTHAFAHEWLPVQNPIPGQSLAFEVLPFAEMPQVISPMSGYVLNCNNDPVGTTVDNNPLNQLRPGGGLYYLSPGYAPGLRMGRIQRLMDAALAGGGKVDVDTLKAFQANNQLLDGEVFVPYVLAAFANASAAGAPAELAALAADPGVAEAVGRLGDWDFSTPTGITAGYDPGDDPMDLPEPTQAEVDASVAATIYAAWRGQVIRATIDATLARLDETLAGISGAPALGLSGRSPGSNLALSALRNLLDHYGANQGFGASGVSFFEVEGLDDRDAVRDAILLGSLREALDLLASEEFTPAFGGSADQGDYRWGYLHRIVFDHPLGGPFNVPMAGGLENLSEELPGVARSGGLGALDASSHSARADGLNEFMFGSGPARRFVGHMLPAGPVAEQAIPGGSSGVLGSPFQGDQLLQWLVNGYSSLERTPEEAIQATRAVHDFVPAGQP